MVGVRNFAPPHVMGNCGTALEIPFHHRTGVAGKWCTFRTRGDCMARGIGFNRNPGLLLLGIDLLLVWMSGFAALGIPSVLVSVPALIAGIQIIAGR